MPYRLLAVTLFVFVLNIPFGYWRANVKRFSWAWVLAVHLPVPVIIALRIFSSIGFAWYTYVFLVSAFFLGQRMGSYLQAYLKAHGWETTSCLVMDLLHHRHHRV